MKPSYTTTSSYQASDRQRLRTQSQKHSNSSQSFNRSKFTSEDPNKLRQRYQIARLTGISIITGKDQNTRNSKKIRTLDSMTQETRQSGTEVKGSTAYIHGKGRQ